MTGFLVKGDGFDLQGPDWARDLERPFYTVSRLEQGQQENDFLWVSDHTLVTDAHGVALLWAMALVGALDDGEHPKPLVRVVAHRTDPAEAESPENGQVDEDEERTMTFVTADEILPADEADGQALAVETEKFGEIVKTTTVESGD
jgi:hypothetical protein